MTAELPGYAHVHSGKVRDLYAPLEGDVVRDDRVLLVASDRISAYDFVLDSVIPDKGKVLTQLSLWWFEQLADLVPNHVISTDVPDEVAGRAVLVERLEMVPVECVARGYLTGGGLAENLARVIPNGLVAELERNTWTPAPIFALIGQRGRVEQRMRFGDRDAGLRHGPGLIAEDIPELMPQALSGLAAGLR